MRRLPVSVLDSFARPDEADVDRELQKALGGLGRKIVVLDDDPTGVQTVHGVSVYTSWDDDALAAGFEEAGSIFFVLTNSRGFSSAKTKAVHADIAAALCRVSQRLGRDYILISRSDSTLRGHYPLETETLRAGIEASSDVRFDGEVLLFFFKEGGRFTIDGVHYVREGDELVPAADTEFAKDVSFGYRSSDLCGYVEEKTGGRYRREDCVTVSLAELRRRDVAGIRDKLLSVEGFGKVVVDAADYCDVKVFATAFCAAVAAGKRFLFRSAAAITKVLGGVADAPLLRKEQLIDKGNNNGGIVLVGSHVKKTSRQLEELRNARPAPRFIEFNQHLVVTQEGLTPEVERVVALANKAVAAGENVVVYTRRDRFDLDTDDKDAQIRVSAEISDAVTSVIARLSARPNFIIAKGGITSSDVGTKALGVKRATVMGQISPGIPVWMTGEESRFPGMPYIIFPGNVGGEETLRDIVELLS